MITYRKMTSEDIPAGLALCRAAGWNQLAGDWELFLHSSPAGCLVAVTEDGSVIGTVATIRYGDHFSWIGMVLVHPSMRKQGIGNQLLLQSLNILSDVAEVKLDATPAGRQVYLKLDFREEYGISRMHIPAVPDGVSPDPDVLQTTHKDLQELNRFDRDVFGADRYTLLEWMLSRSPRYAFVLRMNGVIAGYCFGRPGHNFTHIGPVVAAGVDIARRVFISALAKCRGEAVITDALHHNPAWSQWLTSLGFAEQRPLIRMYRGINAWPGEPQKQFSILGPEFG